LPTLKGELCEGKRKSAGWESSCKRKGKNPQRNKITTWDKGNSKGKQIAWVAIGGEWPGSKFSKWCTQSRFTVPKAGRTRGEQKKGGGFVNGGKLGIGVKVCPERNFWFNQKNQSARGGNLFTWGLYKMYNSEGPPPQVKGGERGGKKVWRDSLNNHGRVGAMTGGLQREPPQQPNKRSLVGILKGESF